MARITAQLKTKVKAALEDEIVRHELAGISSLLEAALEGNRIVLAAVKPLNRYGIQPNKTFGKGVDAREKFKVLRLVANDVIVQNLLTKKIETTPINLLLMDWNSQGIQEISSLPEIVTTIKNILGPVLGSFLTTALIAWISSKITSS